MDVVMYGCVAEAERRREGGVARVGPVLWRLGLRCEGCAGTVRRGHRVFIDEAIQLGGTHRNRFQLIRLNTVKAGERIRNTRIRCHKSRINDEILSWEKYSDSNC